MSEFYIDDWYGVLCDPFGLDHSATDIRELSCVCSFIARISLFHVRQRLTKDGCAHRVSVRGLSLRGLCIRNVIVQEDEIRATIAS